MLALDHLHAQKSKKSKLLLARVARGGSHHGGSFLRRIRSSGVSGVLSTAHASGDEVAAGRRMRLVAAMCAHGRWQHSWWPRPNSPDLPRTPSTRDSPLVGI